MKSKRILADGAAYYCVTSCTVGRLPAFTDEEKKIFLDFVRRVEKFSGVKVMNTLITPCEFYLLLYVPEQQEVSGEDFTKRLFDLYGSEGARKLLVKWALLEERGQKDLAQKDRENHRSRMYSLPQFLKTLKMFYSMSYNHRHKRAGTLWASFFKSYLIDGKEHTVDQIMSFFGEAKRGNQSAAGEEGLKKLWRRRMWKSMPEETGK